MVDWLLPLLTRFVKLELFTVDILGGIEMVRCLSLLVQLLHLLLHCLHFHMCKWIYFWIKTPQFWLLIIQFLQANFVFDADHRLYSSFLECMSLLPLKSLDLFLGVDIRILRVLALLQLGYQLFLFRQ